MKSEKEKGREGRQRCSFSNANFSNRRCKQWTHEVYCLKRKSMKRVAIKKSVQEYAECLWATVGESRLRVCEYTVMKHSQKNEKSNKKIKLW